ncbi:MULTISPECIES: ParB/RepB/Spo0J family partition protein [Bacillota]|jgi:ParB family transcriptional regulator, chromosome partitioning protein|uniref:ParB/RepB/Spo0J family partition protein n=2 Tax=Amedibacillus TaxID=2749846 RepID=A0A7G9GQ53_9FIRM|nr:MULTISPECIES: ParB/RepB/Spo0J family partition protein [Bacillota]QNM12935.1 ParB/RepB/Spo0J family partition protein [[Eubacterium] hominis]MCH4287519.1 ParB/RepB/Spo0J family partition protein [Amedibacillus hominis]RGB48459.1 ParB/RepB/Spo0J family partition protein [Absiella sp. AM22-9]RGB52706.1 ParB/RepB/Spo0J family partition protein [Absiella sp. AM10-20]RGB62621.1 ParB/RepB/Spo0J family partition protein [Absiella sp. AM09-45]
MAKKESSPRLGKGLAAIFGEEVDDVLENIQQGNLDEHVADRFEVAVDEVKPNPYQPRKKFDDEKIQELSESIKQHGVFTPIIVKKAVRGYELVTGERRLRASKLAGLETIPAILMELDDQQMMEIALLENIQREDLNAIEEAQGYEKLIKKLGYTQEELAKRIGKSREHVANMLRLLKLPKKVQNYVVDGELSMGHVRALLGLKDTSLMDDVAHKAISSHMSVRAVEALVKELNEPKEKPQPKPKDIHLGQVEARLQSKFQTKVKVDEKQIVIKYEGNDDLNRLLELLGGIEEEI